MGECLLTYMPTSARIPSISLLMGQFNGITHAWRFARGQSGRISRGTGRSAQAVAHLSGWHDQLARESRLVRPVQLDDLGRPGGRLTGYLMASLPRHPPHCPAICTTHYASISSKALAVLNASVVNDGGRRYQAAQNNQLAMVVD